MKQSGIGRTRARFGLLEMVQVKYTCMDKGNNEYNPWWFPYNQELVSLFQSALDLLFTKNIFIKIKNWFSC